MKKIIALFAVVCMMLAFGSACGNRSKNGTSTDSVSTDENNPFAGQDFGGAVIKVMCMKEEGGGGNLVDGYNELYIEKTTGDIINDAIYTRKLMVENALNCKLEIVIEGTKSTAGTLLANHIVKNDGTDISVALIVGRSLPSIVSGGYLYDLADIETVDLSNDWWSKSGVSDMTIAGKCFAAPGNASVYGLMAPACIYFNKDVIAENLGNSVDLYQLVRDGKWTLEALKSISADTKSEHDGMAGISIEDRIGFVAEYGYLSYLFSSIGGKTLSFDDTGKATITVENNRTSSLVSEYLNIFSDVSLAKVPVRDYDDNYVKVSQYFMNKKITFYGHYVFDALDLRAMDGEFGMLPTPMLDEGQDGYYSGVNRWLASYTVVPKSAPDKERAGVVAEALNYYGKEVIRKAVYTQSFESGRSFRDGDSIEMFGIIIDSQVHDVGLLFSTTAYNWFSTCASSGLYSIGAEVKKTGNAFKIEIEKAIQG